MSALRQTVTALLIVFPQFFEKLFQFKKFFTVSCASVSVSFDLELAVDSDLT